MLTIPMMLAVGGGSLVAIIWAFLATYKVVGTNEAHVIVFMGRGRKIKSPVSNNGIDGKTSYFYIPFLMKRYIMPLTNVKLDINEIHLNDVEMAPFKCDVVTWLHIEDPVKAAERLDFSENVFISLHQDLSAIVQAIARASAMKQEILDIMRDRATFAQGVSVEVDGVLKSWGVQLVNLEINEIRDQDGSEIIQGYESMRKATIASKARIEVATRNREAIQAEQENLQLAEISKAEAEKAFITSQIERDKSIGISTQKKDQDIAVAEALTNAKKVDAMKVITVGEANVTKEAAIVEAEGRGEAIRIQGEKEANVVSLKGKAEADVVAVRGKAEGEAIEARGLAEALAKDKMADALVKFNDAATGIEKIKAWVEVQKAFADSYGKMAQNADIKVVTSGEGGNILGLPMNAQTGADIGQMIESMGGVGKIADLFKGKGKSE